VLVVDSSVWIDFFTSVKSPLIATFCIQNGYLPLHNDRDFDVFEQVRGLRARRH